MPRSSGRVLAIGALLAGSAQLAFVTPSLPTSSRSLRSRVSLAASQAEVDAAKETFDLQKWAADKLATEGSPAAAAAATRAQQAEAAYMALKAELDGQPAPVAAAPAPVAAAPVAAAPVAAAPVAAPVAAGGASKEELDAAKKQADLLTWAADKLASEGSPMAAAAATRAQQAEAAYLALKDGQAAPAVAAAPAVSAPVAAAPVAAPVAVSGAVTKEELDAAKKQADLFTWAANKLAAEGAPQAAAMKAKAEQAVAEVAAKQALFDGQPAPAAPAPVAAPVAAAPVAAAPVAAAPVAAAPAVSGASDEEVSKAKAAYELHAWAADQLAAKGDAGAAAMQAKAAQSLATYEALKASQEKVMVGR